MSACNFANDDTDVPTQEQEKPKDETELPNDEPEAPKEDTNSPTDNPEPPKEDPAPSHKHSLDEDGVCTICDEVVEATKGIVYGISDDGSYAEVVGYNGTATRIRIAEEYEGVPVTGISDYAFYNESIISIIIPDSVTSIGDEAFASCDSLTSIEIPDSVETIGNYAFHGCTALKTVTFGENSQLLSIGSVAFYCCESLTSITIPDSVTSIGDSAFSGGCKSLTSLTIGKGVTSIGNGAFRNCYKLVEVYNLSSLNITKGSRANGDVGYYALNVYTPTSGESKLWTNDDGYIFYKDGDTCYLIDYNGNETALTLPESCNGKNYAIYQYAFYDCDSLISVAIPDSVETIGEYAFSGCHKLVEVYNLSSLNITKGSYNEHGCVGYYALDVYTSTSGESKLWTNDDGYIFYEDGDTCYLIGYLGVETDLTLPESCNGKNYSIYKYAFYDCDSLTSITIPDSVTNIGERAFSGCSSLTSVTFKNTSGWTASKISLSAEKLSDTETAAKYLRDTYSGFGWERS